MYLARLTQLETGLSTFSQAGKSLPGISTDAARHTLAMQLVESERKIDRVKRLAKREPSIERYSPASDNFDPELAAIHFAISGDTDEASWLTFLSVHFGRHKDDGWDLCKQIYGGLGPTPMWTWARIKENLAKFEPWLAEVLTSRNSPLGRFGNHRKYESLRGQQGTAAIFGSYVNWVVKAGGHPELFAAASNEANGNPRAAFGILYKQMDAVLRFGRLGKFDYLTMISKLGIAPIDADSTYLANATGPKRGAKLLFSGSTTAAAQSRDLEEQVAKLGNHLNVGMQAMEDAICNWQKSPKKFIAFRG